MKRGRSFWKWLILWARASNIYEIREKRINREILKSWLKMEDKWTKEEFGECEDEKDKSSADESSTVGFYGSDCGDGAI